jgi:hypothetical protein
MEINRQPVPGTSRQRIITKRGAELERQFVYLKSDTWEALRELARQQGTSGSVVIARLIWLASKYNAGNRQA